jgi:hypothetical protein
MPLQVPQGKGRHVIFSEMSLLFSLKKNIVKMSLPPVVLGQAGARKG